MKTDSGFNQQAQKISALSPAFMRMHGGEEARFSMGFRCHRKKEKQIEDVLAATRRAFRQLPWHLDSWDGSHTVAMAFSQLG